MSRDRQDTLPGVPLPSVESTAKEELQTLVRDAVAEAFRPYGEMWTRRGQDMLEVLAEAVHSRMVVRSSVRTIKATSWLMLLVLLGAGIASWVVLDHDRVERRRAALLQEQRRTETFQDFARRVDRVCQPDARVR